MSSTVGYGESGLTDDPLHIRQCFKTVMVTQDKTSSATGPLLRTQRIKLARNSIFNIIGVVVPALVALACTAPLLAILGAAKFGLVSIQLAVLILLSINDFGVSRAIVLVSIARGGFTDSSERAHTVRAGLELVLLLSASVLILTLLGTVVFAIATHNKLGDTVLSWLLVGIAASIALPVLPLRAKLEVEERFGMLNLFRSASSSALFLAPLIAVWITPTLASAALGHLISRMIVFLAFAAFSSSALFRDLPARMGRLVAAIPNLSDFPMHSALLSRGSWLGIAGLVSTVIGYVDRFALGLLATATAVAHYAVAAELATKIWLVVGAFLAAATPKIAGGWQNKDDSWRAPFQFLAILVCSMAIGLSAFFNFFGDLVLRRWLGAGFDAEMVPVLAILSIGITINCISQLNYLILLVAGGERAAAKLQLLVLPLAIVSSVLVAPRWGAVGVAWVFTGRLILDCFVIRYMTSARPGARQSGISYGWLLTMSAIIVSIHFASVALN